MANCYFALKKYPQCCGLLNEARKKLEVCHTIKQVINSNHGDLNNVIQK